MATIRSRFFLAGALFLATAVAPAAERPERGNAERSNSRSSSSRAEVNRSEPSQRSSPAQSARSQRSIPDRPQPRVEVPRETRVSQPNRSIERPSQRQAEVQRSAPSISRPSQSRSIEAPGRSSRSEPAVGSPRIERSESPASSLRIVQPPERNSGSTITRRPLTTERKAITVERKPLTIERKAITAEPKALSNQSRSLTPITPRATEPKALNSERRSLTPITPRTTEPKPLSIERPAIRTDRSARINAESSAQASSEDTRRFVTPQRLQVERPDSPRRASTVERNAPAIRVQQPESAAQRSLPERSSRLEIRQRESSEAQNRQAPQVNRELPRGDRTFDSSTPRIERGEAAAERTDRSAILNRTVESAETRLPERSFGSANRPAVEPPPALRSMDRSDSGAASSLLDKRGPTNRTVPERVDFFANRDADLRVQLRRAEETYEKPLAQAARDYTASRNVVKSSLFQHQDQQRQDLFRSLDEQKRDLGERLLVEKDQFFRSNGFDYDDFDDYYDRDDDNVFIDIDLNFHHVHGPSCGHYYYDNRWHDFPRHYSSFSLGFDGFFFSGSWHSYPSTHVHHAGCGHFYDAGVWLSYGGHHHTHYPGCGHYHWGGLWHDYPVYHHHHDGCGHYYYDSAWHVFPRTHIHSASCGHYYDGLVWHVAGVPGHRHGPGCGHYHYRDRWWAYPESYYRYRRGADFFFFVNLGDYNYRRVPEVARFTIYFVSSEAPRGSTIYTYPRSEPEPVSVFEQSDPLDRAYADFAQQDYFASIVNFSEAIERDPDDGLAHLARAQSFVAIGDYRAAYNDIIAGMARIPDWPQIVLNLTEIYPDPQIFSEHLQTLEAWVEDYPHDYRAHFVLGYICFFIQDYERAKYELIYTLAYSEDHPQALLLLDEIYQRQAVLQEQQS